MGDEVAPSVDSYLENIMVRDTLDLECVRAHAERYAEHEGARQSVAVAYGRHYSAIVVGEDDARYWPSHRDEFFRWLDAKGIAADYKGE